MLLPKNYKKMNIRLNDIVVIILIIVLCSFDSNDNIEFVNEPVIVYHSETPAPLTCYIDFETKITYKQVIFTLKDTGYFSTLNYTPGDKKKSGYLIMFMKPGVEYNISLELIDNKNDTVKYDKELIFNTPMLPSSDAEFPKIHVTKLNSEEMEDGVTLFNPRRRVPRNIQGGNKFNKSFGMLTIVDHEGNVLWYYRTDSRISDFDLLPNGKIFYMTQDSKITIIDFAGNIINQWYAANRPEGYDENAIPVNTLTFHHDAAMLPNGNILALSSEVREIENYYTSETDEAAPRKTQKVMGDIAIEFTPQGEIVHKWNAFDYLPVFRIGYQTFSGYWQRRGFPKVIDWSHANAIVPIPGEDSYLINFRYQNAMIKIDKANSDIKWIFAEPSGWNDSLQHKLLKLSSEDWCWHQHCPRFTPSGNLLFFNNNNFLARPFNKPQEMIMSRSHAIEYRIDEENMSVDKVWSSEIPDEQNIASTAMGGVSELPKTGNILAAYGFIVSKMPEEYNSNLPIWTMVRECKHTTPTEVVWEMMLLPKTEESRIGWTIFGAVRINLENVRFGKHCDQLLNE